MLNMEQLISRILQKISEVKEGEIMISKLDFDYAYGQLKLGEQSENLCKFTVTGGKFYGFYVLVDIPTIFH